MDRMTRAAITLMVACAAAPLGAQWLPGPAHDTAVARTLRDIPHGARIRVALLRNRWVGTFDGFQGDTLSLGTREGTPMQIRFNAVDTLWRFRRGTRRGALLGAIGGVGLGSATAIAGGNGWSLVVGGVAGTALGALAGSSFRWWRRELP